MVVFRLCRARPITRGSASKPHDQTEPQYEYTSNTDIKKPTKTQQYKKTKRQKHNN